MTGNIKQRSTRHMKQMKAVRDVYARVDRRSGSVAENAYLLGSQMVQCVVLRGVTVNIVT